MMKNILILGGTGMLGSAVVRHFTKNNLYSITATYRTEGLEIPCSKIKFDVMSDSLNTLSGNYDYILNCIGITKPFITADIIAAIEVNSVFPHRLADWCCVKGIRLIHVTSDCVYSGLKGKYIESDPHDALDDYGKSKSLGECTKNAMVLRTSIIGEELHKNAHLLAWAKSQKGKKISGYSTHRWNGVSTNEYARVCDDIIINDCYSEGLYHIFAADDVTKFQMMHYFNEKYNLNLTIEETQPEPIDRTMRTEKDLCAKLSIPTVKEMIAEMM